MGKQPSRHEQSKRFLQCVEDNFLTQVVEEPTRQGVFLDLVLTNMDGLVRDVKVGGSVGCSNHEMVEFKMELGGRSKAKRRIATLDFRKPTSSSSRTCLGVSNGLGC